MIEELRKQYYEAIKLLNNKQDIINTLPNTDYENFYPIIRGLISLIEKSILEAKEELEALSPTDIEMQEYIQEELDLLQYKKDLCLTLLQEAEEKKETEISAEQHPQKNLIFATISSGNICLERDLKDLPEEYYDSVGESLKKLEEGYQETNTEKGKSLKNNAKLANIHEIKPFKVRIFYKNLSPDTVYVMLVRMKKGNNDLLDREEAIIRNKNTLQEFNKIKQDIKDPQLKEIIIEENKERYKQIFEKIKTNRRA